MPVNFFFMYSDAHLQRTCASCALIREVKLLTGSLGVVCVFCAELAITSDDEPSVPGLMESSFVMRSD